MHHLLRYSAVLVLTLALSANSVVTAQETSPDLQNRLMERSDGAVFIYKDGYIHAVEPAVIGDSTINALPTAEAVVHLDTLFAPTPSIDDELSAPPLPGPRQGEVLYQTDWSQGLGNWPDPADWQVSANMLTSSGDYAGVSLLIAPYQPPTSNYAVEAEIQWLKYPPPPTPTTVQACGGRGQPRCISSSITGGFGLAVRGNSDGQIYAGIVGDTTVVGPTTGTAGPRTFNHGQTWQTYRAEADGKVIRLLIGGVEWLSIPADRLDGSIVGVWAQGAQINVRAFRVIAL